MNTNHDSHDSIIAELTRAAISHPSLSSARADHYAAFVFDTKDNHSLIVEAIAAGIGRLDEDGDMIVDLPCEPELEEVNDAGISDV